MDYTKTFRKLTENQKTFLRWCRINNHTRHIPNTVIDDALENGTNCPTVRTVLNKLRVLHMEQYSQRTTLR